MTSIGLTRSMARLLQAAAPQGLPVLQAVSSLFPSVRSCFQTDRTETGMGYHLRKLFADATAISNCHVGVVQICVLATVEGFSGVDIPVMLFVESPAFAGASVYAPLRSILGDDNGDWPALSFSNLCDEAGTGAQLGVACHLAFAVYVFAASRAASSYSNLQQR